MTDTLRDRLTLQMHLAVTNMDLDKAITAAEELRLWPTVEELRQVRRKLTEASRHVTEASDQADQS